MIHIIPLARGCAWHYHDERSTVLEVFSAFSNLPVITHAHAFIIIITRNTPYARARRGTYARKRRYYFVTYLSTLLRHC